MFTGIVQHLGTVVAVERVPFGAVLTIDPGGWSHTPAPGSSIAVNGCCLTCTAGDGAEAAVAGGHRLRFDVIRQTLSATTLGDLEAGDPVNLEHAVTPASLLGGHIVQGHVDGVGVIRDVRRDETDWRVEVEPPAALMDLIVEKGSIALDGVSLTIASVGARSFEVALIPTTIEITTLGRARVGGRLNLETDCIAKLVVNWLERQKRP